MAAAIMKELSVALQKMKHFAILNAVRILGVDYPQLAAVNTQEDSIQQNTDPLLWDGLVLAKGLGGAPKHKRGIEVRRIKRHDMRRFYPFLKSRHMLVPCDGCGGFKKKFHMCDTCYDQTRYETQQVREKLEKAGLDLSEETILQYKNDAANVNTRNRVFSVDRPRPSAIIMHPYRKKTGKPISV